MEGERGGGREGWRERGVEGERGGGREERKDGGRGEVSVSVSASCAHCSLLESSRL